MKRLVSTGAAAMVLAGGAYGQTSVVLYGVATSSVQYVNHMQNVSNGVLAPGSGSTVLLNSSGIAQSRFGLRGMEDLGNGYRGLFVLESQFNTDNGQLGNGGLLFGRQAFVGIGSPYGTFTFGRQYTSAFLTMGNFSPTGLAPEFEPVVAFAGPNFRENNMVKYDGKFGPLSVNAHWSLGERAGTVTAGSAYGVGLSYFTNGLGIGMGYDEVKTLSLAQVNGTSGSNGYGRDMRAMFGLSYAFRTVKLVATYRWGNSVAPSSGTPSTLPHRDDMYWVGATWDATLATHLTAAWYYDDIKRASIGGAVVNPKNPQQFLLLADYNLSRRTDLFAGVVYARNASLNWDNIGYLPNGQSIGYLPATAQTYFKTPGAGGQAGISVGIRHIF